MKPKQTIRSATYKLEGGGFLHFDYVLVPIIVPEGLGAVQPLAPSGQDEKMPIADLGGDLVNNKTNEHHD